MNRHQLQELSKQRLEEARALLKAEHYSGAYYLAGYSVECALKAIIAKGTIRHDFPDRKRVEDSYSHNLEKLLKVAELDVLRDQQSSLDRTFAENWGVAIRWSEQSLYKLWERSEAEGLVQAISQRRHGVMAWLIQRW